MTRILNEKWLTKVDFSKGVIELTEWEEKIYQQGKADAIEEVKTLMKEYVNFENVDIFVDAINKLKEQA